MIRDFFRKQDEAGADGGAGGAATEPPPGVVIPENWHQALPEDFRGNPSISKFKTVQDLAKSYVNIQKQFGDKIMVPDQFATKEDWDGVFTKLGKPGAVDGYEIKLPEGFSEEEATWLKQTALETNLLPNQLEGFLTKYSERMNAQSEAQMNTFTQERAEAEKVLRAEWGVAYDTELQKVQGAAKYVFDEAAIEALNQTGLSSDPNFIKGLHKVAALMKEHKIVAPNANGSGFEGKTPAQAQEEINRIMGDRTHPYWNGTHPNNKTAVDHVQNLYSMVHQGAE